MQISFQPNKLVPISNQLYACHWNFIEIDVNDNIFFDIFICNKNE